MAPACSYSPRCTASVRMPPTRKSPQNRTTILAQGGLALVGRSVDSSEAAAEAAADGANFLILEPPSGGAAPSGAEAAAARQRQRSSASIPVIAVATAAANGSQLGELLAAGVDGLVLDLAELSSVSLALTQQRPANASDAAAALLQQLGAEPSTAPAAAAGASGAAAAAAAPAEAPAAVQLSQLLSTSREELVDAERQLFSEVGRLLGGLSLGQCVLRAAVRCGVGCIGCILLGGSVEEGQPSLPNS